MNMRNTDLNYKWFYLIINYEKNNFIFALTNYFTIDTSKYYQPLSVFISLPVASLCVPYVDKKGDV